jgi:capsular polysaccharide transport system permease protein
MIAATRHSIELLSNWIWVIWTIVPELLSRLTRGSRAGFLLFLLEPIIMVCVFYALRGLLRQQTPDYGTSLFLFYASGFMPFYLFMRTSSRMRRIRSAPNSLLPNASGLDVFLAAAVLSTTINLVMTVLLFYGIWLYGIDQARPVSIVDCVIPLALFVILGMGVGMINNVISRFLPFWPTLYAILTRGLIFLSGVVIIVDLAPPYIRDIATINPLSHGIEWFRLGVYGRYPHNSLDRGYLVEWAVIALFLGFVMDRAAIRYSSDR